MAEPKVCLCGCGGIPLTGADYMRGHWKRSPRGIESTSLAKTTHGMTNTRVYNIWVNMVQRCNNPNVAHYERYGGRGITVCERWLTFENFFADMGEPPEGMEIDRVKNHKGYEPENCEWVTKSKNCRNRRSTRWITVDGKQVSMAEAAEMTGISYDTMKYRIKNNLNPLTGERNE